VEREIFGLDTVLGRHSCAVRLRYEWGTGRGSLLLVPTLVSAVLTPS